MKNIKHVDHHISEYAKIISQLKDEISELKIRLSYENPYPKMLKDSNEDEKQQETPEN